MICRSLALVKMINFELFNFKMIYFNLVYFEFNSHFSLIQ